MKTAKILVSVLAISILGSSAMAERADWRSLDRGRRAFTFYGPSVSPNSNNNYDMPLQANAQTVDAYCDMAVYQATRGRLTSDWGQAVRTREVRGRVTYYSPYGRKPWDDKKHNSVDIADVIRCDVNRGRGRGRGRR